METPTTSVRPASGAVHVDSPDASINAAKGANIAQAKLSLALPKDARDLIIATVMSAAIITIVILGFLLHDAYKDIQTQIWLKQDKEEEKFQKFVAGPYAQLAGELRANEILFSQCKEPKK